LHCKCPTPLLMGTPATPVAPSIPSSFLPPSEAGLGLGDVDLDAVGALRGRVLAKRGRLLGRQQALARLVPLLLRRGRGRGGGGGGVCALLAAQRRRSALTGLPGRGLLLLALRGEDPRRRTGRREERRREEERRAERRGGERRAEERSEERGEERGEGRGE